MKTRLLDDEEPQFQMAPMIDMVFLLLIFFMCASHLSQQQHIPLDIPTATRAVVPTERPDRWVVNVTRDGTLYSGEQPAALEEISALLKARLAENPNTKVYLRADANCEHKIVKKVMNAMALVGVDDFIFGVYIPTSTTEPTP